MYIDWEELYYDKFKFKEKPNFLYPLKEKYAVMFRRSNDFYNDLYKYCYENNIDVKDTIKYPDEKTLKWLNESGVLY